MCFTWVVSTLFPNSRRSPWAATMSFLMALPPQVQPLIFTRCGDSPIRSNHPPQTQYDPSSSTQIVYTEFLVVTRTRSPERRSSFRICSSDRACSMRDSKRLDNSGNVSVPRRHLGSFQTSKSTRRFLGGLSLNNSTPTSPEVEQQPAQALSEGKISTQTNFNGSTAVRSTLS
jgi:hypothetical protein